jgi:hypothetical protein
MTRPILDAKELIERSGLKDQLAAAGYSVEDTWLLDNVAGSLRYRLHQLGMPWTEDERRLTEARDRLYRLRPYDDTLDAFLNRICDAIEADPKKFAPPKNAGDALIESLVERQLERMPPETREAARDAWEQGKRAPADETESAWADEK